MKKLFGLFALLLVLCLACVGLADGGEVDPAAATIVVAWGENGLEFITTPVGHNPTFPADVDDFEWIDNQKVTCLTDGVARVNCTTGGEHFHTVIVKALGHDWASDSDDLNWGVVEKKPSCTENGLARDICLRCGEKGTKTRVLKATHEYDLQDGDVLAAADRKDKHFVVKKESTCQHTGTAWKACVNCGYYDKKGPATVILAIGDHKFTDWTIEDEADCATYGVAVRVCTVCDLQQKLDKDSTLTTADGKQLLKDTVDKVKKVNSAYTEKAKAQEFDTWAAYKKWAKEIEGIAKITKEWNKDCYTVELTYSCPVCLGKLDVDGKKIPDGNPNKQVPVHPDFVVTLKAPAVLGHVWNAKPEPFYDAENEPNGLSLAPTCTEVGYRVTLCQNHDKHTVYPDPTITPGTTTYDEIMAQINVIASKDGSATIEDLGIKLEKLDPLGHDWSDWVTDYTYAGDVEHYTRYCKRCGKVQNTTDKEAAEKIEPDPASTVEFKLDDDGEWRVYINSEFAEDFTDVIYYDGGRFAVFNGVKSHANGLTLCYENGKEVFYFLADGQVQTAEEEHLEYYDGNWFWIAPSGRVATYMNGLLNYDDGWFVFALGRLCNEYNGLWYNDDNESFYFLANGQVQSQYSGVALYDGEFFYVVDGIFANWYTGIVEHDGAKFNVVNGQLYGQVY